MAEASAPALRVIVIGGGPSGISAAIRAAELGARVTLLERGSVGGTVRNAGPAPVRTLARAARLARDWDSWATFGLRGERPDVDLGAALANALRVSDHAEQEQHLADRLRAAGIELVEQAGGIRFADARTVVADDGRSWSGERIIVAVGGHAGRLPIPGAELALTYADVASIEALPERVCVIGGADTGCQLASILADFGVQVSLIEWAPRLIPAADADVAAGLEAGFRARGIEIVTGASVQRIEQAEAGIRVVWDGGSAEAGAAFFAVGWPGNAAGLDPEAAGLSLQRGYLETDAQLRTAVPHIFAIGDVLGQSLLVSSGVIEGRVAAENAVLDTGRSMDYSLVPTGSFTGPEYGRVGLTEQEARQRHEGIVVAVAPYQELLRPIADAKPEGFCKLIVRADTRTVVGAHVLGDYSAEVIQTVAAFMLGEVTVDRIAEMQFAFPTFTEGIGLAARQTLGMLPASRS